jgi:hypothetical protein
VAILPNRHSDVIANVIWMLLKWLLEICGSRLDCTVGNKTPRVSLTSGVLIRLPLDSAGTPDECFIEVHAGAGGAVLCHLFVGTWV